MSAIYGIISQRENWTYFEMITLSFPTLDLILHVVKIHSLWYYCQEYILLYIWNQISLNMNNHRNIFFSNENWTRPNTFVPEENTSMVMYGSDAQTLMISLYSSCVKKFRSDRLSFSFMVIKSRTFLICIYNSIHALFIKISLAGWK